MLKFAMKFGFLAALAGGAAVATFGADRCVDWMRNGQARVKEQINEFQGMSAELRKIRNRVDTLDREIAELKETALREELGAENLEADIKERQSTLEHLRKNLEKANSILNTDVNAFNIGGVTYTRKEIEQDVADKMRLFKVHEDTVAQLRKTLLTRRNALQIAQENVARGKAVRQELAGRVDELSAQLEHYKAREIYAEAVAMDFDAREFNTEIGEARQLLAKFERKLMVKNRMLDDQIRVGSGSGHVAGIDYEETDRPAANVSDELALLLERTDADGSKTAMVVLRDD